MLDEVKQSKLGYDAAMQESTPSASHLGHPSHPCQLLVCPIVLTVLIVDSNTHHSSVSEPQLDLTPAPPPTSACWRTLIRPNPSPRLASLTEREPDAHRGTDKPETGADESEGLSGAPLVAEAAVRDAAPVESRALAAGVVDGVDEQAEGREPGEREEDVEGPVEETAGEGEEPEMGWLVWGGG